MNGTLKALLYYRQQKHILTLVSVQNTKSNLARIKPINFEVLKFLEFFPEECFRINAIQIRLIIFLNILKILRSVTYFFLAKILTFERNFYYLNSSLCGKLNSISFMYSVRKFLA